jgi:hypothetical protein
MRCPGVATWAANALALSASVDFESFRNATVPLQLARLERLKLRNDVLSVVYQCTQAAPPPPVACTDPLAAILCAVLTRSVQPVGVTCFHVVYLLVLGRLLHFVARSSSTKLALLRRFARAVVALTVVGDMVRLRSYSHCICSNGCAPSHLLERPFFFQVGIAGNFTCAGYLLSSLRQTAAAATAFDSGTELQLQQACRNSAANSD